MVMESTSRGVQGRGVRTPPTDYGIPGSNINKVFTTIGASGSLNFFVDIVIFPRLSAKVMEGGVIAQTILNLAPILLNPSSPALYSLSRCGLADAPQGDALGSGATMINKLGEESLKSTSTVPEFQSNQVVAIVTANL
ncbi:hypothetical protein Tco_0982364 [Tanacetum coccineum]